MKEIQIGTCGTATKRVAEGDLASAVGSGALRVFSTPSMVALMEAAAVQALAPFMEDDESSVGIRVDVSHLAATPPGVVVTAKATLTEISGRTLAFHVTAHDGVREIGSGTHERAQISVSRFLRGVREIHKEKHI